MFKIRDPFQIKKVEDIIGRSLTGGELDLVDDGEELILATPGGGTLFVNIDVLSLNDLVGPGIEIENLQMRNEAYEYNFEGDYQFSENEAGDDSEEDPNESKQYFRPDEHHQSHFEFINAALNDISHLFNNPTFRPGYDYSYIFEKTNMKIIELHLAGKNNTQISKWLTNRANAISRLKGNKRFDYERYKVLSEDAVDDRLRKQFHILGERNPAFLESYLNVSESKEAQAHRASEAYYKEKQQNSPKVKRRRKVANLRKVKPNECFIFPDGTAVKNVESKPVRLVRLNKEELEKELSNQSNREIENAESKPVA